MPAGRDAERSGPQEDFRIMRDLRSLFRSAIPETRKIRKDLSSLFRSAISDSRKIPKDLRSLFSSTISDSEKIGKDLRSLFRSAIPETRKIRVLNKNASETVGSLLDINQKGFRLETRQNFPPGATLVGLIEIVGGSSGTQLIPFTARCAWNIPTETGFALKEIPREEEAAYDALIDQFSGEVG